VRKKKTYIVKPESNDSKKKNVQSLAGDGENCNLPIVLVLLLYQVRWDEWGMKYVRGKLETHAQL